MADGRKSKDVIKDLERRLAVLEKKFEQWRLYGYVFDRSQAEQPSTIRKGAK